MTSSNPYWPALLGAGAAALAAGEAQAQVWRSHEPHVLGSSLDMAGVADLPASAIAAARAARAEIDRLDALLSGWRGDSELARLNASTSITASPDLFDVVQAAERWRIDTGGAFDARLGAVTKALRTGATDAHALNIAARAADIGLDAGGRRITRPHGAQLDLDGIAKGHVIDAALAAARRAAPAMAGMLIDIGGDLRAWGHGPSSGAWRIGMADPDHLHDNAEPAQTLRLTDKAVAFSGPGLRDLIVDGRARPHILAADGLPARHTSAAVVADSARDADALATALCAMEPLQAIALVDRLDGFEAMVIDANGRRLPSRGWSASVEAPAPPARLYRAQAAQNWPAGFTFAIDDEVPPITRERARCG